MRSSWSIRLTVAAFLLLSVVSFTPGTSDAGERYALLIGVRKYSKNSGLRPLKYAERDVEQLAETLLKSGYRSTNVMVMTQRKALELNELRHYPSRENIEQELSARLKNLTSKDSILVAFAGHGVEFQGKGSYFCPADGKVSDAQTLISLKDVYRLLDQSGAGMKLVISDACRDEPIEALSRRAVVDLQSETRPQDIPPPKRVAALFSCSSGQVAYEHDDLEHGVFFYYLIKAFDGDADLDGDRTVDLLELAKFTQQRVKDFVFAEFNRENQTPQLVGTTSGEFPLATVPPKPVVKEPVRLAIPVGRFVKVTARSAEIKVGNKVVATATQGDRFRVAQVTGEWLSVDLPSVGTNLGWIHHSQIQLESARTRPNDVFVRWGDAWWPATTLKVQGDRYFIRYYGHDSSWNEWVESSRISMLDTQFEPYDALVKWNSYYWPAKLLKRSGDRYLIHFVGYNTTWDDWVERSEIRALNEKDETFHAAVNQALK